MRQTQAKLRTKRLVSLTRGFAALGLLVLSACAAPTPETTESKAVFYPPLPQLPRIQFLTTLNSEDDLGGGSSAFQEFLVGKTKTNRRLSRAGDMAHEKGKLYVVERNLKTIVTIDLEKGKFDFIKDTKGGPMKDPMSVFVTKEGHKFVADKRREQVLVFNERNEFLRAYGAEKQFLPTDVVVFGNRVYVCDIRENEIEVLDRTTGEVITKIGETGQGNGMFRRPTHLTVDGDGNIYVTNFLNFRIEKFDKDGNFLRTIGKAGTYPGTTPRPKGIASDKGGFLYAVDAAFELIQVFDGKTADIMLGFGKYGPQVGSTYLPNGIHVDYDNVGYFEKYADKNFRPKYLIYVSNQVGDNKINVYAFGEWIGPPPAGAKPAPKPVNKPSAAAPSRRAIRTES